MRKNNLSYKKGEKYNLYIILIGLFAAIAFAIPDSLTLQGKLTNQSGGAQVGTYNFSFILYDAFTGGNILYQENRNITTDANGIYDVILYNLSYLNFSNQYYLGIAVANDSESVPRINLTSNPYSFRANVSEDLNKENKYEILELNVTGNLSLGTDVDDLITITSGNINLTSSGDLSLIGNLTLAQKISFSLGSMLDNLVSGFLRIGSGLNVTGNTSIGQGTLFVDNTSSRVGIGTATPAVKLVVIGNANISDSLNVSNTVQATTFVGDGSALTGISTGFTNNSDINVTRFVANNTLFVNGSRIGIGTSSPETTLEVAGGIIALATNFTYANVSQNLIVLGNIYGEIPNSFKVGNWTTLYNGEAGTRFDNENFTTRLNAENASLWNRSGTNTFLKFIGDNVGIGTNAPTKALSINGTTDAITLDPSASPNPVINTTGNNLTISSASGSIIIRLG